MKHLHFLLAVLLLSFNFQYVYSEIKEASTDFFYCGFSTYEEFDQWTVIDSDEDGSKWYWEGNYVYAGYRGRGADDWFISPTITFSGTLKNPILRIYWTGSGSYYETIAVTIGNGNNVEAQTTFLLEPTQLDWQTKKEIRTIKLLDFFPEGLTGDYNIGFHITTPSTSIFSLNSILVTELSDGVLEGTLTNSKDDILSGVTVSLQGEYYKKTDCITDENGKYSFKDVPAGEYKISVNQDGHDPYLETITIEAKKTVTHDIRLIAANYETVSATVVDESGAPVKNAVVTLTGELSYNTITDEDGKFAIEKVRECEKYTLKIEKDLKITHVEEFALTNSPVKLGEIVMKTRVVTPLNIKAETIDAGVLLSWMMPLKETEISCDNGNKDGGLISISSPTPEFAIAGNVFNYPMVLSGIKWVLSDFQGNHNTTDIYIFSLNKNGSLSNNLVYCKKDVPNTDNEWSEYRFPEEIVLPYGGILAIGNKAGVGLVYDGEGSSHSCYSYDYVNDGITSYNKGNFLVRGIGSPLGVPQLAPARNIANQYRSIKNVVMPRMNQAYAEAGEFTYNVWRLNVEDKENQDSWTKLDANLTDLTYIDRKFNQLPQGSYQYAVQAVYADGKMSDIGYSEEIEHLMSTDVTIIVTTSTAVDMSKGAVITLENADKPEYTYTKVAEGHKTVFKGIRKGMYNMTVIRDGFEPSSFAWTFTGDTGEMEFELDFIPKSPFNAKAVQDENTTNVTFNWNTEEGIFEDFEGMEDFSINPAGELGWTYTDVDRKATYGMQLCEFNNMESPMAYMAFNPSQTSPSILEYVQPHSGDKVLVDMAAIEGANNDYLFSPSLSFETDFVLSFYAKAGYFGLLGDETFMVGYCEEEATPEDVTWITTAPQSVGGMWTQFVYDIPKEAKYITIRCISEQKFVFALDDIYIGYKESDIFQLATFNVYLDEELVGKTNNHSMVFDNLSKGKHLIKVQAVYPMANDEKQYSDFVETMITVEAPSSIKSALNESMFVYDMETGIILLDKAIDNVSIIDAQGRRVTTQDASHQINTADWATGIYIIKIKSGNKVSFGKILVQ